MLREHGEERVIRSLTRYLKQHVGPRRQFLTAGAMAALGDLLTAEFFLTTADTEKSAAYSWATAADNRWYINTKFLNRAKQGQAPGNPYYPTRFYWTAPGFSTRKTVPANSYGGEAIRTSYVPVKQVTGTVTTDWGSNDTADVWLEDYAAAYQGSIGDAHFAWSDYFEYYSFIGYTTYLDQVYLTTAFYNYTDQPMWVILPSGEESESRLERWICRFVLSDLE